MKTKKDYYRLASGFYQFEALPNNYRDLGLDEFHKLLEANEAWRKADAAISFANRKGLS